MYTQPGLRIRIRIIFGSWIQISIRVKSWIRIRTRNNVKIKSFRGSKQGRGGLWTITMRPWRVHRKVVVDPHQFEEELDPDPGPMLN
jgi:hypothetical protein